jgi:hypothetical protein
MRNIALKEDSSNPSAAATFINDNHLNMIEETGLLT